MKLKKRLNKLFLGREEAKHLQELELDMSDAAFAWYPVYDKFGYFVEHKIDYWSSGLSNIVPTYTLQEVLDKLPQKINVKGEEFILDGCLLRDAVLYISVNDAEDLKESIMDSDGSLFENAYDLLCWVLENGYYKPLQNVTH